MAKVNSIASKFMNRMFRRVGGVVWDITSGKLGLKDDNGIYTLELTTTGEGAKAKTEAQIVVNPFDAFGIDIPAFATTTKLEDVALGDVIVGDSKILGFVIEQKDNSLVLLDKNGMRKQYNPPKVAILGTDTGVLVMKNLMSVAGGESGLQGLQGGLMPLLMMGGDIDLESILPLMLFSQQSGAGANAGMNSMLPMLLMKGGLGGGSGGSKIDPLMLIMLGGMGGAGGAVGAGGMNPLLMAMLMGEGDVFGSSNKPTPLQPAVSLKPSLTRL
jgi:hypothetical protein